MLPARRRTGEARYPRSASNDVVLRSRICYGSCGSLSGCDDLTSVAVSVSQQLAGCGKRWASDWNSPCLCFWHPWRCCLKTPATTQPPCSIGLFYEWMGYLSAVWGSNVSPLAKRTPSYIKRKHLTTRGRRWLEKRFVFQNECMTSWLDCLSTRRIWARYFWTQLHVYNTTLDVRHWPILRYRLTVSFIRIRHNFNARAVFLLELCDWVITWTQLE